MALPTGKFHCLTEDQKTDLKREYSSDKVWRALRSMGPLKAPGPDGFPVLLIQKMWTSIGSALVKFAKQVLERGHLPHVMSESLLILIPKEDKPTSLKGFRPISLCNVCIKLVSKWLIKRLKGVWGNIISLNQGAFLHVTYENTIIC